MTAAVKVEEQRFQSLSGASCLANCNCKRVCKLYIHSTNYVKFVLWATLMGASQPNAFRSSDIRNSCRGADGER